MDRDGLESAIEREEWREALALALHEWRLRRSAALADLVDLVGERARTELVPARAGDPATFHATWLAKANEGRPEDLTALFATIARSLPTVQRSYWAAGTATLRHAAWLARLEAIAKLPDDPRAGPPLLDVLRRAPWTGGWTAADCAAVYEPLLQALERTADERVLAPMRALHAAPIASRQVVRTFLAEALPRVIAATEATLRARPRLEEAENERIERLIDALGGRRPGSGCEKDRVDDRGEAALFELVVQDPEDDGAREVLSDYWLERSDPRGQLVTLQLKIARGGATEADHKAIRAIVREHEKAWVGELALVTKSRVFRRGFLHELELLQNSAADPKVWESAPLTPALATVRTIHKGKANETHYRRFVGSPMARSLSELTIVSKDMLSEVCGRAEPWVLEHLELAFMPDKKVLATIAASTALPRLTKLSVGVGEGKLEKLLAVIVPFTKVRPLACIAASPIRWYARTEPLAAWLEAVRGVLAHVPAVAVASASREITARAGATGLRVDVVADNLYFARQVLTALPPFEHLSIRLPDGMTETNYQRADEAADVFAAVRATTIVMDDAWTKLVARRPPPTKNYNS